MFATLIAFALSKVGRYVIGGLIVAGLLAGLYYKIRHDAQAALIVQIEKEKADAIEKARAARDRIRDLCARDPAGCLSDNGWWRD